MIKKQRILNILIVFVLFQNTHKAKGKDKSHKKKEITLTDESVN